MIRKEGGKEWREIQNYSGKMENKRKMSKGEIKRQEEKAIKEVSMKREKMKMNVTEPSLLALRIF